MALRYRGPAFVANLVSTSTWEEDRVVTLTRRGLCEYEGEEREAGPMWSTPGAYDDDRGRIAAFSRKQGGVETQERIYTYASDDDVLPLGYDWTDPTDGTGGSAALGAITCP